MKTKIYSNIISIALAVLMLWIIKMLGITLIPVCIAMILTYLTTPLIKKLQKVLRIKHSIIVLSATIIILLIEVLIPTILIPTLISQIKFIIEKLPLLIDLINTKVLSIFNHQLGSAYHLDIDMLKNMILNKSNKIDTIELINSIAENGSAIGEILFFIILTPFVFYYTSMNWDKIMNSIKQMIPLHHKNHTINLFKDIDQMLSAYLRGQAMVMLCQMVFYITALNIIGLNFATTIGAITGFLVFIPVFGFWTGAICAILVSLSGAMGYFIFIKIAIVFICGNLLENTLTPYFIGNKLGISPIVIIFALLIFGQLFGLIGVILSLPLTTISIVLVRHLIAFYKSTDFYNGKL